MVCIPCLLLPLVGLFVVLFDFVKPFLVKIGVLKAPQKVQETKITDQSKIHDTPTDQKVKQT